MRRAIGLGLLAVLAVAVPASAATVDVSIVGVSAGFDPASVRIALGDAVRWTNEDDLSHTTTQSGALALWDSGTLADGQGFSFAFTAAGTYPYRCDLHPTTMTGTVRVPVTASPASGGLDTAFVIRIGSRAPDEGFVLDVQRRVGGGRWRLWRDDVAKARVRFHARSEGTYAFRARLEREGGGASRWSPAATVTVG